MFVVCGEALMDVFANGDTATGLALDARVGGSPCNVAMGLARLGQPVTFFGGVSRGFLGQRLLRSLRDEGIGTDTVVELDAPTTLSLVGLDAQGVPSYSFYGEHGADRQLPRSALPRAPEAASAYQFGSYTLVVEPVAGTLRALVEREHRRSLIACDPNIRLDVAPDLGVWRDVLQWMLPRTHLLKVSDEDLALLHPGADAAELARQWLLHGVSLVVLTRGARGATAWTARHRVDAAAAPVQVIDTVGAGDTFQAALLAWLAERGAMSASAVAGLDVQAIAGGLRFANQAAGITCSRRGADLPRRNELPR